MEVAGLAIGVVGIAGLFSTCLEVLERFDSYRDFGTDLRHLASQFEADKLRFENWGLAVGIRRDLASGAHHEALDDPQTRATVDKLLLSIKDIGSAAEDALFQPSIGGKSASIRDRLFSRNQIQPQRYTSSESTRSKLSWALREKAKRILQVEQFGKLVQSLHDLVPPSQANHVNAGHQKPAASNGSVGSLDSSYAGTEAWTAELQRFLEKVENEIQAETRREVRTWLLSGYSLNELYDNSIQTRLDGTCNWILERPAFRNWIRPAFPGGPKLLWVHGPAGFGKTVLCARVIEHLTSEIGAEAPIAHFFFSSDFESRGDPYAAIRSWILQIISNPQVFEVVYDKWKDQESHPATRAHITSMFHDIVHALPGCTFVIDGLDECNWLGGNRTLYDNDSVSRFLENVSQAVAGTSTRIMIMSRDEPEIRQFFFNHAAANVFEYKISVEDVRSDTESYSKSVVDRKLSEKPEAIRSDISQRMAERCSGQFLWIKMQEDSLDSWMTKRQLDAAVRETPAGLEQTYGRYWKKISGFPSWKRNRAFSLLRWVAFAFRPLTVCEVTEALLVDDDCDDLPVDEIPSSINETYINSGILGLCGSLIEVRGTSSPDPHIGVRTVHLTHFSVRQYFVSNIPISEGIILANERLSSSNETTQNTILAKLCLRYVNFRKVWQDTSVESGPVQGSFKDYAAGSWYRHVAVSGQLDDNLVKLTNKLFDTGNANWASWSTWFDIHDTELNKAEAEVKASPLYYASWLGLTQTVRHLLQELRHNSTDISTPDGTALGAAARRGNIDIVDMLLRAGAQLEATDVVGRTPLFLALCNRQLEVAKFLLEMGANVKVKNKEGYTALHVASQNGHLEGVNLLLAQGAEVKVVNNDGMTPLYLASRYGNIQVVELLLKNGAEVEIGNKDGWTPLHTASEYGNLDVVRILLKTGAEPRIKNKNGWTPLHWASRNGNIQVVELLLKKGAEVEIGNKDGWTPLHGTSEFGNLEITKLLLNNGANVKTVNKDGWTPLHMASMNGHLQVAEVLVENGAEVRMGSKDGRTPLHLASKKGHLKVSELLLQKGAEVNVGNNGGWTPLHVASEYAQLEVIKLLLNNGAETRIENKDKWTPLHLASQNGHLEVVDLLLEKGAEVKASNKDGMTPLYSASRNGNSQVASLLLDKGADVITVDKDGWTPLHVASEYGQLEVTKLLLDNGAETRIENKDKWTPLHLASQNGHLEVVDLLLEKGAEVKASNKDGMTPLYSASRNGNSQVASFLLDKGADVKNVDKNGRTPLHVASQNGHHEVVKLLLGKKADVNVGDKDGITPLYLASQNGHLDIVSLLLKKGAEVMIADKGGWTPLHMASQNGHLEVVKLLLDAGAYSNVQSNHGLTPLLGASLKGHLQIAEILLQNKADANLTYENGVTALYAASAMGHFDSVSILLKNGADIKMQDKDGMTSLHMASQKGHTEVVKMLLEMGADKRIVNKQGHTSLHLASRSGNLPIVKLLLEKSADHTVTKEIGYTPLDTALLDVHLEVVQPYLEQSEVVAANKDYNGRTALFLAATWGHEDVVRWLLSRYPSELYTKDNYNATPVFAAVRNRHESVVELLLASDDGTSIGSRDLFGRTLMWWASGGSTQLVQLIHQYAKDAGFQIDAIDTTMENIRGPAVPTSPWCDVCTLHIQDGTDYYVCGICDGGYFYICPECHKFGVFCQNESHKWELRKSGDHAQE